MAKIIEARAIISGEEKLSPLLDRLAKKFVDVQKLAKTAVEVDKMAASIARVNAQMTAMEKFNASRLSFAKARKDYREAQIEVDRTAKAMKAAEGPARQLEAAHKRAAAAVKSAARAFEMQKSALLGSKRALEQHGIPINGVVAHQARLAAAVDRTNAALQRQQRLAARRQAVGGAIGTVVGGIWGAYRTREFGRKAIVTTAEFDIGTRKQRAFTDISAADQAAILTPQAKKIGQDTPFTNLDVVQAQTAAMQGLPTNFSARLKAEVAAGILENVKNYALVMEADLKTSAEAIRSYLQATNKDISTKEKALAEANKATNQLVKMAKLGGMSDEDVQHYMGFALPTASAAGVTPEAAMAIAALARRGGLRGDVAGVFMRTTASKLVAPTKKGLTALNSAGINYNDYVKMPESLDVGRLEGQFQQDLGTKFTPEVRAKLTKALNDPKIVGDRGAFTAAVTDAVADQFPKTKNGQISAADRQKIAKSAGNFYKTSAASVDAEGLLDRIMASNMTLAQLNAFLTDKHGGKGAITQRQRDEYVAARRTLQDVGDDPDFAKRKADEIMGGFGGALENLRGSFENVALSIGQSWEGTLKPAFDGLGKAMDWFSNLPKEAQMGATAVGAVGAVGGAALLAKGLMGGFGLAGSAVALDASAAALMSAATALGGSAAAGKVAGAAGAAGGAAASAGGVVGAVSSAWAAGAPALPFILPAVGAGLGVYGMYDETRQYAGMTSGERMAKARGGSMRDVFRDAFNEERDRLGIPRLGAGGEPVKAELSGSAKVTGEAKITIDIPGLPSRIVNVPLSGAINANGPGSLGTSSPDTQPGWGAP